MNIAVIAANGRTGKIFVEQALAAGHNVRAGVYGASTLTPHNQLSILPCDATNPTELADLIKGQDAVASFIGHVKGSPAHVQTDAMRALVESMHQQGITRVVSLTGTGVRFAGDAITLIDRILNLAINMIDPARIADGRDHATVLQKSGLDWTIIRVLKLQDTKPRSFTLLEHGPTKWYVSRQEVAQAALRVLEEGTYVRQAPIIGKP